MPTQLERVLAVLCTAANTYTSSGRITVCRELVHLENRTSIWQSRYPTFQSLITDHRFCDWSVYVAYKAAADIYTHEEIQRTGFWASLRLSSIPHATTRNRIANELRRWQHSEGLFTSYQAVDKWLQHKYPETFPPKEKDSLVDKLRIQIRSLSASYERVALENQRLKARLEVLS